MRFVSALTIVCVCALAILWGWQVLSFAEARASSPAAAGIGEELNVAARTPGLRGEALDDWLRRADANVKTAEREAKLESLLAVRPMSATAWFSLAGAWAVLGRAPSDVDAAATMSALMGPNEGRLMWQRGLFGLLRWKILTDQQRWQTASDLAGALDGGIVYDDRDVKIAATILDSQSPEIKDAVIRALNVVGLSSKQMTRLGLKSDGD